MSASAFELEADRVRYERSRDRAEAQGRLRGWAGDVRLVSAPSASTNLKHRSAKVFFGWYTTCDLPRPHTQIFAPFAYLKQRSRFFSVGNVVFLGKVPIFIFPVYFRPLGDRRYYWHAEYGSSTADGLFLKNIFGYATTDDTAVQLYLDRFTKRGWGTGAEFLYHRPGRLKGALYGYQILDKGRVNDSRIPESQRTATRRWNAKWFQWWNFAAGWTWQGDVDVVGEEEFKLLFTPADFRRVQRDLRSSTALTWSGRRTYAAVNVSRLDSWDPAERRFERRDFLLPSAGLRFFPVPLFSGPADPTGSPRFALLWSHSYGYSRRWTIADQVWTNRGNGDQEFSLPMRVFHFKQTWTPFAGITGEWTDRRTSTDTTDLWIGTYRTGWNLNTHHADWYVTDLGHLWRQRINERDAVFGGVLEHRLTGRHRFSFGKLSLEQSTSYDLRVASGTPFIQTDWRERFSDIVSQAWAGPWAGWSFYLRHAYNLFRLQQNALQFSVRRDRRTMLFQTSLSYDRNQPNQVSLRHDVSWHLFPGWRVGYTNQYVVKEWLPKDLNLTFQEAAITRDLHEWEFTLGLKDFASSAVPSGRLQEVWFRLDLRPFQTETRRTYPEDPALLEEWYPWKKGRPY